ncbi:MAG: hypothetical protein AAGI54_10380 [Planctomycetota bacterium]
MARRGRSAGGALGVAVAAAAAWLLAPLAIAQADDKPERPLAQIVTTDGRTFAGELVEQTPSTVVLGIAGIDTPFSRDVIASLEVGKTVSAEYDELKADLDESDPGAWAGIVEFLFDRGRYELAKQEVDALIASHPNYEVAKRLRSRIDSQILLIQQTSTPAATPTRPVGTAQRATVDALEPTPAQEAGFWLTAEDVNKLRLWELPENLSQAQPRIVVPREAIDELYENYTDDPALPKGREARNRFRALPGWQQLELLFKLRARELYPKVRVVQDPPALQTFRGQINPAYVVGYFRQHFGRGEVPGLYLLRYRPNTAESAFANFLALDQASYEGEQFIDRDSPQRSLLLQWGLPRDDADLPAPPIDGWRPFFTGPDDSRFVQYADWIGSLYDPAPDYGTDYNPPSVNDVLSAEPATTRP